MKRTLYFSLAHSRTCIALAVVAALLAGCATPVRDQGLMQVQTITRAQIGKDVAPIRNDADRDAVAKRVAGLLGATLTADNAVQIALLNNRGLQTSLFELGISDADLMEASRLPNPGLTLSRPQSGADLKIEQGLSYSVARVLVLPWVAETERSRSEQMQRAVALDVLTLAADTRKAFYSAVAARETVRYMEQVKAAAEAGAELARRMAQAGNFNALQRAREQAFYADATLNLARAQHANLVARERLTRLLGLWGEQTRFVLPERLPDLPPTTQPPEDIEQRAMAQRLDVLSAKLGADKMAKNLGLTRVTRFLNVLDLGLVRKNSDAGRAEIGYEVSLELPIFDWGESRIAKAEAFYMQALNHAAETAVNARSEVREAYHAYRTAYDIAKHYRDEIVPVSKRISEENLLRYNGMLIGVFELLADARSQIASVNGAIAALRDYWLAQSDLDMAMIGKPSLSALSQTGSGAPAASGAAPH
jgi:outer membrane protein TolC